MGKNRIVRDCRSNNLCFSLASDEIIIGKDNHLISSQDKTVPVGQENFLMNFLEITRVSIKRKTYYYIERLVIFFI